MSHIYIYTHLYTWQWELHLQHEVSTHAGILILPTCPSLQVGPHPLMPRNCFRNAMLPLISWYWWPGCENGEMVCLCLWRGLIVQALHSCTPWTAIIYIYIYTPFSPMHMLFSFYLLLHSWPGLSHFLLLCWLWSQRLAAPFSSSSDRAGTTRRTARPPSASASPGCDNGGFRGFEDRFSWKSYRYSQL